MTEFFGQISDFISCFCRNMLCVTVTLVHISGSHITLQPKTGRPLKISRVELVSTGWETPGKTRLLLEEVLVRPAGGAVCVGPNTPV